MLNFLIKHNNNIVSRNFLNFLCYSQEHLTIQIINTFSIGGKFRYEPTASFKLARDVVGPTLMHGRHTRRILLEGLSMNEVCTLTALASLRKLPKCDWKPKAFCFML